MEQNSNYDSNYARQLRHYYTQEEWKLYKEGSCPKESGRYICVIIYPEFFNNEPTGKTLAEVTIRQFIKKYGWCVETGSYYEEKVYAWVDEINLSSYPIWEHIPKPEWDGFE